MGRIHMNTHITHTHTRHPPPPTKQTGTHTSDNIFSKHLFWGSLLQVLLSYTDAPARSFTVMIGTAAVRAPTTTVNNVLRRSDI